MKSFGPRRLGLMAAIFCLTLLTSTAEAATGWFTASISLLEVDSNGKINVYFNANTTCGTSHLVYVHTLIGNDDAKAMFAALLSWQAQGLQVAVYIPDCLGGTGYGEFDAAYSGTFD